MGLGVLIIGRSGTGKSCSLRNFADGEVGVLNVQSKPMPFPAQFRGILNTDNYSKIAQTLKSAKAPSIVIDDAGYLLTNCFMLNHRGKTNKFDFYNELADDFWNMLEDIKKAPAEKIVYVIMHEEQSDFGVIKPKTLGKLLDNTVCIEGLFTIVLRSMFYNEQYVFATQTNGADVAKSPMGMFPEKYIPNDLRAVDAAIRDYYSIAVKPAQGETK